jgi:hypothetical protein
LGRGAPSVDPAREPAMRRACEYGTTPRAGARRAGASGRTPRARRSCARCSSATCASRSASSSACSWSASKRPGCHSPRPTGPPAGAGSTAAGRAAAHGRARRLPLPQLAPRLGARPAPRARGPGARRRVPPLLVPDVEEWQAWMRRELRALLSGPSRRPS